ncbi:hypothetical protein LTR85_005285 [Meristemomyces frigidus]|nr:hypothetical protein LTR85_005285 [Meristemomyces frigidus]
MAAYARAAPEIIPPGPPLPIARQGGVRLLALDGGGVGSISSIIILDAIMEQIRYLEGGGPTMRKPSDYFDLAGGTGTGGIIALMLFRLHMDTKYRVLGAAYGRAALAINAFFWGAGYSPGPLEKAIREVVDQDSDWSDPWHDYLFNPRSKMMFMCATHADKGESILLRSYLQHMDAKPISSLPRQRSEDNGINSIKIVQAARATSAAPSYLPPGKWNGVEFWDGGLLNNNPIEQVWDARYDLVGQYDLPPKVACVLSIGCGWSTVKQPHMVTTEAKHRDFAMRVHRMQGREDQNGEVRYHRLNVATGDRTFDMVDLTKMGQLEALTRAYIGEEEIKQQIAECAKLLANRVDGFAARTLGVSNPLPTTLDRGISGPTGCGTVVEDWYLELIPGSVERGMAQLASSERIRNGRGGAGVHSSGGPAPAPATPVQRPTLSWFHSLFKLWDSRANTSEDPETQAEAPQPSNESLFIFVTQGRHYRLTKRAKIAINALDDCFLFLQMREQFNGILGPWRRWLGFKRLGSIRFVKVCFTPGDGVEVILHSETEDRKRLWKIMPPVSNESYRYMPKPAAYLPPVGHGLMKHWYFCPEKCRGEQYCTDRFLKHLAESVRSDDTEPDGCAWGLELTEANNLDYIFAVALLVICSSVVVAIVWETKMKTPNSKNGGFAVAGYMLATLGAFIGATGFYFSHG